MALQPARVRALFARSPAPRHRVVHRVSHLSTPPNSGGASSVGRYEPTRSTPACMMASTLSSSGSTTASNRRETLCARGSTHRLVSVLDNDPSATAAPRLMSMLHAPWRPWREQRAVAVGGVAPLAYGFVPVLASPAGVHTRCPDAVHRLPRPTVVPCTYAISHATYSARAHGMAGKWTQSSRAPEISLPCVSSVRLLRPRGSSSAGRPLPCLLAAAEACPTGASGISYAHQVFCSTLNELCAGLVGAADAGHSPLRKAGGLTGLARIGGDAGVTLGRADEIADDSSSRLGCTAERSSCSHARCANPMLALAARAG
jgi:hypothetical protein